MPLYGFSLTIYPQSFVNEYEQKLNDLCDQCKQMKQIYNKVLVRKSKWKCKLIGEINYAHALENTNGEALLLKPAPFFTGCCWVLDP